MFKGLSMCPCRKQRLEKGVKQILLLYRTSPHQTTSAARATLLFNRHVKNGIP